MEWHDGIHGFHGWSAVVAGGDARQRRIAGRWGSGADAGSYVTSDRPPARAAADPIKPHPLDDEER